jgi:hypothetical protein
LTRSSFADELGVRGRHAPGEPEVVLEADPHVAPREDGGSDVGQLVLPEREGRVVPVLRDVVDHRQQGLQVVRRPPGHAHAQLHQHRVRKDALGGELPGEPQVPRVEGLDLGADAGVADHGAHGAEHAGRVGHDVVRFGEVHGPAVQRAYLRQACADRLHALRGAGHVRARGVRWQGGFHGPEHEVAAHARREVEHDVRVRVADAFGDLAVEVDAAGRGARVRVADMTVHDGGACPGRLERRLRDLFGAARDVW